MKIKTILIAAMLAISGFIQAQVSEDAFKKAVDYVNCKSVEFSLKKSPTKGVTGQFQAKCSCHENPDFINIKSAISQTETKTIELSAEIDKVKMNEFKPSLKPDEIIKLLTEDIFTNQTKYKKLFDFASKRKDDAAFASMKLELKNDLATQFATQSQVNNSKQKIETEQQVKLPSLEERVNALEQRSEANVEDKGWFEGFTFQIDVFSIILSIVIMFLILKIVYDVSESIKGYVRSKINDTQFKSSGNSGSGPSLVEVSKLNVEIEKLKEEVKQLSNKIESSKISLEIVQQKYEQQSWQDTKQPDAKAEILYLSTPNPDGSFNEDAALIQYKEGASIYKFKRLSPNKAEFEIDIREFSIKLALQYPELRIDPCCIPLNAFNSKAKKITTSKKGVAELNGNKWELKSKAEINYES